MTKRKVICSLSMLAAAVFGISSAQPASTADRSGIHQGRVTANVTASAVSVTGGGTGGHLAKWIGSTAGTTAIGDSSVFENKAGQVGIGTSSPGSLLTVAGTIESRSGGIKFPDGTVQTTAGIASGSALTSVAHDQSLTGNGTPASPLAVVSDPAALEPFQAEIDFDISDGEQVGSGDLPAVPAGKRLVIEYASAKVQLPQGQRLISIQIDTPLASDPSVFASHFLLPVFVTDDTVSTNSEFAAAQELRLYVDATSTAGVDVARNSRSGAGFVFFTISGHLVDLDQSSPTAARRRTRASRVTKTD